MDQEFFVLEYLKSFQANYWAPGRYAANSGQDSFRFAVEKEIINCYNKSVVILWSENIKSELSYLSRNYPTKTFFVSNSSLLKTSMAWRFAPMVGRDDLPFKLFVAIYQSGIYKVLRRIHQQGSQSMTRFKLTMNNSEYGRFVRPLGLKSNIGSVFFICVGPFSACCNGFCFAKVNFRLSKL